MIAQQEGLQVGQSLENRYSIVASGTPLDIGVEYKGYDTQRDRLVVVSVLDSRYGSGSELVRTLNRNQQDWADLAEPGLLPSEHAALLDDQLFLVRDDAKGHRLTDLLQKDGSLEIKAALEIVVRICDALEPAHRSGLVHGSLSSYSVFVAHDGQIIVVDAGLFPALHPEPAAVGQPWGRFPYITPEQAAGHDVVPASDVYVIGSLLYEMLAGQPPFRGEDDTMLALQHLSADPPSLQVLAPSVPLPLAQIVHKSLAKEPAARYRNAGQLAAILRSYFGLGAAAVTLESETPSPARAVAPPVVPVPYSPSPADRMGAGPQPAPVAAAGAQESGGIDWILIGLLIVGLVAILGLIPLWRTVYRRYALPPDAAMLPPPGALVADGYSKAPYDQNGEKLAYHQGGLEDIGDVCYNQLFAGGSQRGEAKKRVPDCKIRAVGSTSLCFGSPDYGLEGVLYYTVSATFGGGRM